MSPPVKYENGKAHQKLDSIDLYGLEGEFQEATEDFKKQLDDAKIFYSKPHTLPGYYINGERDKTVCFNRFYLSVGVYDNDVKELEIWGEREIQPDEQKILDEQQQTEKDAQRTHDLSEFERLKKKLNIQ